MLDGGSEGGLFQDKFWPFVAGRIADRANAMNTSIER